MAVWIIDDGPLDSLALAVQPAEIAAWPPERFLVAEATALAASGRRQALLGAAGGVIGTFRLMMGTPAADALYQHLRQPGRTNTNLAENQAIAWALVERTDAILVTVDQRAALNALAELGCGRVAHAFDLWLHLRDEQLISAKQFAQLCTATRKSDQALPGIPLRCRTT